MGSHLAIQESHAKGLQQQLVLMTLALVDMLIPA